MPYIKKDDRPEIDKKLASLLEHLNKVPLEQQDGAVNYTVTRLIRGLYEPRYFNYNRAIGVLESIKLELYRRQVAEYEDKKIAENGDV